MRIHLGYPDPESERELLIGESRLDMINRINPITEVSQLIQMQQNINNIHASDAILDYVQKIMSSSRSESQKYLGLSPRAGIYLLRAARAWAMCEGREAVLPEDVQAVSGSVLEHRLDPEGIRVKGNEFRSTQTLIKSIQLI